MYIPSDGSNSRLKGVFSGCGSGPGNKQLVHRVKETGERARHVRLLKRRESLQKSCLVGRAGREGALIRVRVRGGIN